VVVGIVLISNSASLFIVAVGYTRGPAPILPLPESSPASDPLVQAMALTAIVISSSVVALLLALIYRLYVSHDTADLTDISEAELREAEALERKGAPRTEEPEGEPEEKDLEERSQ
jgi:multicomponent Na+:H+ antiporter subunit C